MSKRLKLSLRARARFFTDRGGRCELCSKKISHGEKWHIDHIIPLAIGGSDSEKNWQLLHIDCHSMKTKQDRKIMAKADRQAKAHLGLKRKTQKIPSRGFRHQPSNVKQLHEDFADV